MSVVISEFQIVTDAPAPEPDAPPDAEASARAEQAPAPYDIQRVLRHERERRARVRAH